MMADSRPRVTNIYIRRFRRVALMVLGVAIFAATGPRAASSQAIACLPDLSAAPSLHVLDDADLRHVRLEINVDPNNPPATGRAVLTLRTADADADSVRLVTSGAAVVEVISQDLDDVLSYRRLSGDTIVVDLRMLRDTLLVPRDSIALEFVIADIPGVQIVDGFAWTIDPLLLGGAWYPWSGNPADRFTSELLVTVPEEMIVGASGRRLAERSLEEGTTTFLYATSEPHDARSLVFAAGPYVAGGRAGRVSVYHRGSLDTAPEIHAGDALRSFERGLDFTYPYGRLSLFVVPGAAAPVAGNGILLLSDNTVAELGAARPASAAFEVADGVARQWFGGVVSPAGWEDGWIMPALSGYLAALFVDEDGGKPGAGVHMQTLANEYRDETRHYLRPLVWEHAEHPADLVDAHARGKGVWAMHALRREIGLDAFSEVVALLLSWNQFDAVSTDDLERAREAVTEARSSFFDQWIYSAGHPELASSYSSARDTLFLTIEQQQLGANVPEEFDLELEIEVGSLTGSQRFDVRLDDLRKTFSLPFPSDPRYVVIDPHAHHLLDVGMEQSLSAWIAQLRNASTPHARLAATTAVSMRRGDPAVLIGLRSALTQEREPSVKAAILRVVSTMSDSDAAQRSVVGAFEDSSWVVRAAALEALGAYIGSTDVERLALEAANNDPVDAVQAAAVELLGRIGSRAAPEVAEAALITPSRNDVIQRAGLRVLALLEDRARDLALQAATTYSGSDYPVAVRREAIDLLEKVTPRARRAENSLLELLQAPDWQLRLAASEALLRLGNADAVRSQREDESVSWVGLRLGRLLSCK